uniref:Putative immobilization antigen isoform n=1 Tax=Ichthyophthirius multifiliis TaxID=5932 RepID=A0A7G7YAI2_ICHMU|nr:putative immobilization antigen isoform [Ichthyophthirius multifiliis]
MKYNILIILIISLFVNQLRAVNCPPGSQTADGSDQVVANANLVDCTMCKINYYYARPGGANFVAGNAATGVCTQCPNNRQNGQATLGNDSTLAVQCDVSCPAGTAINTGATSFVNLINECVNCAANFYHATAGVFQAGVTTCEKCPVNLNAGPSTAGDAANIATQCDVRCPENTETALAATSYVNASSECANCRANTYYGGQGAFQPGTSTCTTCPQGGQKANGAVATQGSNAKITAQCNVSCPTNTVNANGDPFWTTVVTDCLNCAADHYFSDAAFNPGVSQCKKCPVSKATPTTAAGSSASIITQCNVQCPAGTVLDDGSKNTFVTLASECTKCAANYYISKTSGFAAGTDTCTECTKKLTSGATAKPLAEANQKAQCASSTFAKFLSISLIFISFYLL